MSYHTAMKTAQCPRCDGTLKFGRYHNQKVHHCSSCSGTLFALASLGQALEELSAELFCKVSPDAVLPELTNTNELLNCPHCASRMENYGYMGSHKVMLDSCIECNMIWVDALELAAMAKMRIQTDKRLERFNNSYHPVDIVGVSMTVRAVEAAFLAGFVLG